MLDLFINHFHLIYIIDVKETSAHENECETCQQGRAIEIQDESWGQREEAACAFREVASRAEFFDQSFRMTILSSLILSFLEFILWQLLSQSRF